MPSSSFQVWPWGEVATVEEVESRLTGRWPESLVDAAIWKLVGDAAAGHMLVDLEQHTLDRKLPLALLSPDAAPVIPRPLPEPDSREAGVTLAAVSSIPGPTFDPSHLPEKPRELFYRNWRAVSLVLADAGARNSRAGDTDEQSHTQGQRHQLLIFRNGPC